MWAQFTFETEFVTIATVARCFTLSSTWNAILICFSHPNLVVLFSTLWNCAVYSTAPFSTGAAGKRVHVPSGEKKVCFITFSYVHIFISSFLSTLKILNFYYQIPLRSSLPLISVLNIVAISSEINWYIFN